jgi:purine-binding chemotaxis protein CheW
MGEDIMKSNALVKVANTENNELIQLVSFALADEEYGLEVLKVREIIRMPAITKMPNTSHYVEGVINLRGKVIPVISMRKRFGLDDTGYDKHTRIIIMDVNGYLTGFIVDGVSEVIRIPSSDIQPTPSIASGAIDQNFITGVINHAGRLLIVMDVDRMFSLNELDCLRE